MIAAELHTPGVVQLLEEYGCHKFHIGKCFNALRLAITTNNGEVLDYLLNTHQYHATIEYTTKGIPWRTHQTLLTEACYVSSAKVINVLLDHGADANRLCGEDCSSVINIAIAYKHVEGVAHIIRSGVDVNLKSHDMLNMDMYHHLRLLLNKVFFTFIFFNVHIFKQTQV